MRRMVGIDPSSTTGFVAMDRLGNVLRQKDLSGVGKVDPKRMETLIQEIMDHIQPTDVICIESPAIHAQGSAVGFMWGLAYGIRGALFRRGIKFFDVAPTALKAFCDGSRRRYDAEGRKLDSKEAVAAGVYEHWGYAHSSDNVVDAYVLAEIARCIDMGTFNLKPYQEDVINTILKPAAEKKADKKEAAKKAREKAEKRAADIAAGIIKPKTKRKPPEQPTLAF